MSSVNWQQRLAVLDANLKHVATEWLRQAAKDSATTNVQLNDEFRQTFLQISNDSLNAAYSIVKGESQFNQLRHAATLAAATTVTVSAPMARLAATSTVSVPTMRIVAPYVAPVQHKAAAPRPPPTIRLAAMRYRHAMAPRPMTTKFAVASKSRVIPTPPRTTTRSFFTPPPLVRTKKNPLNLPTTH